MRTRKTPDEPNPLMLGLYYFLAFIVLVVLVVLICTGELWKQQSPILIVFLVLFICYLTFSETRKYREFSKRKKLEDCKNESLPVLDESDLAHSEKKTRSNWPHCILLRPTCKTKQGVIVSTIIGLIAVGGLVYRLISSFSQGNGIDGTTVLLVLFLVIPVYMVSVNIAHLVYNRNNIENRN